MQENYTLKLATNSLIEQVSYAFLPYNRCKLHWKFCDGIAATCWSANTYIFLQITSGCWYTVCCFNWNVEMKWLKIDNG